jgi:hypothetical protein
MIKSEGLEPIFFSCIKEFFNEAFNRRNDAYVRIENDFYANLRSEIANDVGNRPHGGHDIESHLQIEAFLLPWMDIYKMEYIKNQYWYYLEFQVNLILSIILLAPTLPIGFYLYSQDMLISSGSMIILSVLWISVLSFLCAILYISAMKNYRRFREWKLSYIISTRDIRDTDRQ